MAELDGDRLATDMEVGHFALVIEIGRDAPAGLRVFRVLVEAERWGGIEGEVSLGGREEEEGCGRD